MKHHLFALIGSLLVTFLLTGCPKKDDSLSPEHTIAGSSSTNREDWINETDASYAEGLVPREASGFEGKVPHNTYASVYFQFDNYAIGSSERNTLSQVAEFMKQNPSELILLEGYCDWHGTTEYNLALGDKRAVTVKNYLTDLGISPSRIDTVSKGSLEATPNLDKAAAAKDRRVDIVVMK